MAETSFFIPMLRYTKHLTNIFVNMDENDRKLKKNQTPINKVVSSNISH